MAPSGKDLTECSRCHRMVSRNGLVLVTVGDHKGGKGGLPLVRVCSNCAELVRKEVEREWVEQLEKGYETEDEE